MDKSGMLIVRFVTVTALLATGCASLSPGGQNVQMVADPSSTKACRPLGKVKATPPYGVPDDWKVQLRNESAKLGGNTVLAADPGLKAGSVEGEAFACDPPAAAN